MKSGFVAIVGRANAGKSTLINSLLERKIAITTPKAQTTRNAIMGILNREDLQIVFIDTPGLHVAKTSLGSYMNKEAMAQANGADVICYICDGNKGLQKEDKEILDKLFSYDIPVFLLINKIDELKDNLLIERLQYAANNYEFAEIIPISAMNKNNLDEFMKVLVTYLHDDIRYFPDDAVTNVSKEFLIAEMIREKIIINTFEEIPHLVAVSVEEIQELDNKVLIEATIICNKDTHKGIIIGRNGTMLRKINNAATFDLKAFFGKKVVLSLYVRVEEDWLNKEKRLFELGYFTDND